MNWKAKEKELTTEEATELAKKELAPYWVGSSPLIAGVRSGDRFLAVPLTADFQKKSWLILFMDPTDFSGEASLLYLKEWYRRYKVHELNILAIYVPPYNYLKNHEAIQRLRDKQDIDFPLVMDTEGLIATAFGAISPEFTRLPKIILHNKGRIYLENHGDQGLKDTEQKIQSFLRSSEPGLPLLLIFEPNSDMSLARDTFRLEFGSQSPKRGRLADFFTENRSGKLSPEAVFMGGNWRREAERITTSDASAVLSFTSNSSRVSLIAQASSNLSAATISVEVNGGPVYDAFAGGDITQDDSGRSLIKVAFPQLYHMLVGLKNGSGTEVTLRFPQASAVPISLYGLRFGE